MQQIYQKSMMDLENVIIKKLITSNHKFQIIYDIEYRSNEETWYLWRAILISITLLMRRYILYEMIRYAKTPRVWLIEANFRIFIRQ